MEGRNVCSLGEAKCRLLAAQGASGDEGVSRTSKPDVLALVVDPHLGCPLAKGATRHHASSSEVSSSLERPGLLALGLASQVLLVLVDVAVVAREHLASLVAYME